MRKKQAEPRPRNTRKSTEIVNINKDFSSNVLPSIKLELKHKNETQKELSQSIKTNDVTICMGPAGTGKSLVSIFMALKILKDEPDKYYNIKLIKSITQLRDEVLPALPGDAMDKMYFQNMSFFDSLHQLIGSKNTESLIAEDKLKFDVIGSFRGRNLNNTIVILDECLVGDTKISISFSNKKIGTNVTNKRIREIAKDFKNGKEIFVLSYNETTREIESKKITHIFENGVKKVYEIEIEGRKGKIKATENHPFAVFRDGKLVYIPVSELKENDNLFRLTVKNSNNARILSQENYDILLGILLGDGHISRSKQKKIAYRIGKTHGLKQLNYSNYCKDIFEGVEKFDLKSGYTGKPLCGFKTKNLFIDEKFVNSIYSNDKKRITPEITDYFTERTLAFWYMDDGLLNKKSANLHTCGFSVDENNILISILKNKFDIEAKMRFHRGYPYLSLDVESTKKLFHLVKDYIHPDLEYKILPNVTDFTPIKSAFYDNFSISKIKSITEGKEELT